ncbi:MULTISPECIES: DUF2924 domain-containing protein [unclassified Paracoccus (in: a-proteobacteria)]|uniref:DUF2924 domain-containing protein n=1 Tax=unclassified Paracoccus (in: a-proteobacteria) TaxID=2688777 RepID=UPI0016035406|nr:MULTISPECIES: DUF2924 domain-containing protein [unclassified Paracoccus (in: a-proteobacteria)]MBB1490610.1 DUF2924 domain-containing protein [Paracoccus sp. MC1854]MBB1499288.1 DUF2924 domain-containing protein [Paracoccus sp. MC1862]QQO46051.1 DUF2924 domain-containing protein [Paracoccus sp. MC1862]
MSQSQTAPAAAPRTAASVASLSSLDRAGLLGLWQELHGGRPPRSMSQPLLRKVLAFDLQLGTVGGWPPALAERLEHAARSDSRPKAAVPVAGGRLLREWNGTTHVVEIRAEGYFWNGRPWRSLSAIAREITGAQWSGPRFFGLDGTGQDAGQKRRRT